MDKVSPTLVASLTDLHKVLQGSPEDAKHFWAAAKDAYGPNHKDFPSKLHLQMYGKVIPTDLQGKENIIEAAYASFDAINMVRGVEEQAEAKFFRIKEAFDKAAEAGDFEKKLKELLEID